GRHAGLRIRAEHLGAERGGQSDASGRMAESGGQRLINRSAGGLPAQIAVQASHLRATKGTLMKIEILADAEAVARKAAALIAAEARTAVAARGRFIFAVSGGHTPWQMLRFLAAESVSWQHVHVV